MGNAGKAVEGNTPPGFPSNDVKVTNGPPRVREAKRTVMPNALDLQAEIARLTAENAALKVKAERATTLSMKVTEKGGVSLYGLGRFPVTLYKTQWYKLLGAAQGIRDFLKAHESELTEKP